VIRLARYLLITMGKLMATLTRREKKMLDIENMPDDIEFNGMTVPEHTLSSIKAYVQRRMPVGGFLRAVLTNDLSGAVNRADSQNIQNIPAIVFYLYNYTPSICWGSEENVKNWLYRKDEE
jgi:hypothetical protein